MTFNFLGPGLTVNVEAKVKEQIILDSSVSKQKNASVNCPNLNKFLRNHRDNARFLRENYGLSNIKISAITT